MLALDDIKATFNIWGSLRREDGNERGWGPIAEQPGDVRGGLFLGDLDDANDAPKLQRLGIRAVLNLCPENLDKAPYSRLPERLQDSATSMFNLFALAVQSKRHRR